MSRAVRSGARRARLPRGEGPWAWLAAGSVALSLLLLGGLLTLIAVSGLGHFWPASVSLLELDDGRQLAGRAVRELPLPEGEGRERLYFTGNRDLDGQVWHWLAVERIAASERPPELVVLERRRFGDFIGRLVAVVPADRVQAAAAAAAADEPEAWAALGSRLDALEALRAERETLRRGVILPLVRQLEADPEDRAARRELAQANARARVLAAAMQGEVAILESVDGRRLVQPLDEVLRAWRPNAMSLPEKLGAWSRGLWRFLSEGPRAANTAGGVWPAIFGTVLMVLLMSVVVTPFGVLAAVYLNEVAHQGRLTRWVRIAVRNLAGVPSIVYGVFGLGVFVYGIGGSLDEWFFDEQLPSPTFGTGGLLWASLTLALLTLPVVIVATEEGLARIPVHQREGALALGATRLEMLARVVLPMAVPAMLTGVILAIARAAGEVAPLMLVGVAKLAPQVPVDGEFPFLHLDRKFMHLGYHLYDTAFHGDDVQAAMPVVYATALLLVLVVLVLNLTAIFMRHHLRARHGALPRH
ncbi:phosphate ABC transporter permease PstA [Halomonas campisalis]|uniref:Phosphate transport system permease protein PstA n=1 Tax=Billgrantia campisalis TaxID=74661 RepID=A0ABS9P6A9_9GAMM|nr:phosphate ABC transporter permease PstA [Halomonas campisalis]MCG6656655.1 phosphate ABC transporter permease PstA [Halomonas campisalis]MDR5861843.1 phosphate ABC transporter permease PstA [Halomonas campisalis]